MRGDRRSRRSFLLQTGALVVGSGASITAAAPADVNQDVAVGVLEAVGTDGARVRSSAGTIAVSFVGRTEFIREGRAGARDFRLGDQVSVEGRREGDRFSAVRMTIVYQTVEGTILGQDSTGLRTTVGTLALHPKGVIHERDNGDRRMSPSQLRPGMRIIALRRYDADLGRNVAVKIGVEL